MLFQDLAVIPALALVPLLAERPTSISTGLKYEGIGLAVMLIGGRYLLRPVFQSFIALASAVGGATAATLAMLVLSRLIYGCAGTVDGPREPSLPAFYRRERIPAHELENAIDPFKAFAYCLGCSAPSQASLNSAYFIPIYCGWRRCCYSGRHKNADAVFAGAVMK
ncbi:hypothetical protein KCP78_16930 [Salmonella enterica subsp. enterica]|nr:hypothetical protein KCP78_16930 [Salmonella enterica subsp. enterica]